MATKRTNKRKTTRRRRAPQGEAVQFELDELPTFAVASALDRVAKLISRAIGDIARDHDATPGQLHIVERLARSSDGLTAKQLAAALAIRPGSLTGMLDAMQAKGVLQRESVRGDARQQKIVLLAGAAPLIELLPKVDALIAARLGQLDTGALGTMQNLVDHAENAAREHAALPTPAVLLTPDAEPTEDDAPATVDKLQVNVQPLTQAQPEQQPRTGTDHAWQRPQPNDRWQPTPARRDEGSLGRGLFRIATRVIGGRGRD